MDTGECLMSDRNYLENSRWDWAYLVECETCGWYNLSQDRGFTDRAGTVHTTALHPGHYLVENSPVRIERD